MCRLQSANYNRHLPSTARLANVGRADYPLMSNMPDKVTLLVFVSHGGHSYRQIPMPKARAPLDRIDNPINPGTISRPP